MPRYHVVVGCHAIGNGVDGTMMKSSIRPGWVDTYTWQAPIGQFKFPMDSMDKKAGHEEMTYDGLINYLKNTKQYWWAARIYKNYTGLLDMYIQWASDNRVHHYVLDFDPLFVSVGNDYDGWPAPRDFYLARAALCTGTAWTIDEYNGFFDDPPRAPMLPPIADEPPIADGAQMAVALATTMATIIDNDEEGGAAIGEEQTIGATIDEGVIVFFHLFLIPGPPFSFLFVSTIPFFLDFFRFPILHRI